MSLMLFLDTNVPNYAAGRPHPLKEPCAQILLLAAQQPYTFVTSAEVFQELLHRYRSLRLWSQGRQVFEDFSTLMHDRIEPVYGRDVEEQPLSPTRIQR